MLVMGENEVMTRGDVPISLSFLSFGHTLLGTLLVISFRSDHRERRCDHEQRRGH